MEEWKDIKGYEGYYQVSSLGSIKSLERKVKHRGFDKIINERILTKILGKNGYYNVNLCKNSKPKVFNVHQLVAIEFLNHIPNGYKLVIDHVDRNKLNNEVSNLRIVTHRENMTHHFKSLENRTSEYIGVCWCKEENKYLSSIYFNGKRECLGYFNYEIEAHNTYQNKIKQINNYE